MQANQDFCLILDPTENNMLNVRIVKGGCRGREAVRFGVVSVNFLLSKKASWSNASFIVKKSTFVSGGKDSFKTDSHDVCCGKL